MIISTYSQFRTNFSSGAYPIEPDGLRQWPAAEVRRAGSGFGDTGSTLINIPKPPRNYAPLSISCNNFLPDAVPFTSEYQWFSSSRTQDPGSFALMPNTATLRFVSIVGGEILDTVDGGTTWTKKTNPTASAAGFQSVSSPSTTHRWAVGGDGIIIASQTSGQTWQTQTSGTANDLNSVDFIDNSEGWAAGAGNVVLYTSNGGTTWASVATGAVWDISAISFLSGGRGIVAGDAGNTLWTSNGGVTWNSVPLGIVTAVNDIDLLPTAVGWAVSEQGYIFKTSNAGSTYSQQFSGGTPNSLRGVCAVSSSTAYVVGENGYIIKTSDGGTTWSVQTSGVTATLIDVKFVSALMGWVCGYDYETNSAVILYTSDGGATWEVQSGRSNVAPLGIDSPRVNMGALSFSGSITLAINSINPPSTPLTPEAVATTFKNCHLYVQRLSDSAIQWVDLLRAMVANTG